MTDLDLERFATAMVALGVAFDQEVPRQRMELYHDALSDLRIEAIEWAVREIIREKVFFPKAKEIRDYAGIAPRPKVVRLDEFKPPQVEGLADPEQVRVVMAEFIEKSNQRFGTQFYIDESRGRPELCSRTRFRRDGSTDGL